MEKIGYKRGILVGLWLVPPELSLFIPAASVKLLRILLCSHFYLWRAVKASGSGSKSVRDDPGPPGELGTPLEPCSIL